MGTSPLCPLLVAAVPKAVSKGSRALGVGVQGFGQLRAACREAAVCAGNERG